ncbi:hypothetical protein EDB85DRAFT_2153568 [Lactarius pseudohatsudake]|nr:hypothetical protein EDB85DRAFT_2153568 [Lactarius pseudohatsudake]
MAESSESPTASPEVIKVASPLYSTGRSTAFSASRFDIPIFTAVVSFIVQGYFCYRIWVLNSRSSWICWIIAVAAVTQSAAAIWSAIKPLTVEIYASSKTALYLWAISSALADILIAVAMTLLLRRASGNFSSFVLIRVVRLTIETNTLTATLAITSLVLFAAFPNEVYYAYTVAILGKVYSNTLLVSLNNRIYLRDRRLPEHGDSAGPVPDGARAIAETPLHFAKPEPQPRALKNDSVIFSRSIISQPVDLDDVEAMAPALTGPWYVQFPVTTALRFPRF